MADIEFVSEVDAIGFTTTVNALPADVRKDVRPAIRARAARIRTSIRGQAQAVAFTGTLAKSAFYRAVRSRRGVNEVSVVVGWNLKGRGMRAPHRRIVESGTTARRPRRGRYIAVPVGPVRASEAPDVEYRRVRGAAGIITRRRGGFQRAAAKTLNPATGRQHNPFRANPVRAFISRFRAFGWDRVWFGKGRDGRALYLFAAKSRRRGGESVSAIFKLVRQAAPSPSHRILDRTMESNRIGINRDIRAAVGRGVARAVAKGRKRAAAAGGGR